MAWKPGQSGNPGGRPKGLGRIRDIAQKHTDVAIQTLVDIAQGGESETARVQAATALLDRGWGKPAQTIEHTGELTHRHASELSEAELERIASGGSLGAAEETSGETEPSPVH